MELDFDKTFKISTTCLYLNRAHPFIKRDRKWALQFFILHGLIITSVFAIIVYNIVNHDMKNNNFTQTCKNATMSVMYIVITYQYVVLLCHQDILLDLIRDMNKDYEVSKELSPYEKGLVYKYVIEGLRVCKQWKFIAGVAFSLFITKSFALMVYYYCINEFKLVPVYDLIWYPPIIEDNQDNIYVFVLTYSWFVVYVFYTACMYAAFVPLGPIFILHACGQLELAKKRIDDLFVENDDQVVTEKLKNIIGQLQYVHRFVDRINDIFRIAYELTLKASTILLPITFYEVLEAFNQGEVSLEFIVVILGTILISSSPCYYSNLLMDKGEEVRLSLYSCGWELNYNRRTRKTLQMMMQHATKPIAIRTVFRTVCLDALTELFQQSYAIFNLMNCMWD